MGGREGDRLRETETERYTHKDRVESEGGGKRLGERETKRERVTRRSKRTDKNRDGVGRAGER